MIQNDFPKIKDIITEFFTKTGLTIETIEVKKPQDLTIPVELKMEEPQILIGEQGQTLAEIQRLLKTILQRKIITEDRFYIDLDINDYKKKKAEYLKEMARNTADEVVLTKIEQELPPMPSYERRTIHLALAVRGDVKTESVGQGIDRRVAIRVS